MRNILIFFLLLLAFSCKKPGEGGDATIRGYVHVKKYNSTFTQFISEYPGENEDVYIIYGDRQAGYDDHVETDFNGNFEFPYLYEGDYTVYTYSRDASLLDPSNYVPVIEHITITGRKQVYQIDTMLVLQVK